MSGSIVSARCTRCYGGGEIAVVPSASSAKQGHGYDLARCPACEGSGTVKRRRRAEKPARAAAPRETSSGLFAGGVS